MRASHIASSLGLIAALSTPVLAQNDYCLQPTSNGTIGQVLNYAYSGAPANSQVLFMISTSGGPIPVGLLCAGDPRLINVGADLSSLWTLGIAPTGAGTFSLPIPTIPALSGVSLFAQTITLGNPCIVGQISNQVVTQLGNPNEWTALTALLATRRAAGHAVLTNTATCGSGDILVLAGGEGSLTSIQGTPKTDIYNYLTQTVTPGPDTTAGAIGSATVLSDGRVLLAGGVDLVGNAIAACTIYDPVTNTFSPTGSMAIKRAAHAATLLANGEVLVTGGTSDLQDVINALTTIQKSGEKWNPTTGTWTSIANMPSSLLLHNLVTLNNGRVLASGGYKVNIVFGIPIPVGTVTECRLYDPSTNRWSSTGSMPDGRIGHTWNTIVLNDGRVLVTGGANAPIILTNAVPLNTGAVYNPASGSWTATPTMDTVRLMHSTNIMPDGSVIVAGGGVGTITAPTGTPSVQRYNPASNTWTKLADLETPRGLHTALLTPNGLLVVMAGQTDPTITVNTIEVYRP